MNDHEQKLALSGNKIKEDDFKTEFLRRAYETLGRINKNSFTSKLYIDLGDLELLDPEK